MAYESLMIFVYLGHNYSTNDAAPTYTAVLKWKSELTLASKGGVFISTNAKNRLVNIIGWISSEIFLIIWLVFKSRCPISVFGKCIILVTDQFFIIPTGDLVETQDPPTQKEARVRQT